MSIIGSNIPATTGAAVIALLAWALCPSGAVAAAPAAGSSGANLAVLAGQSMAALVVRDEAGDTIDTAKVLSVRRGLAKTKGTIDFDGDVDVFGIVTPNAAPLTVELLPGSSTSSFSGTPTLLNASGDQVVCEAVPNGLHVDAVGAGEAYYVRVEGVFDADESGNNKYALNIHVPQDEEPNTIDDAQDLPLRRGKGKVRGSIDFDWDVDVFRVIAASTSPMSVDLIPQGRGSTFDGELTVYNSDGDPVATGTAPPGGGASLSVHTTGGEAYCIEVGGVGGSTGAYQLTVFSPPDDHGNTVAEATDWLAKRGIYSVSGSLNFAGDLDVFHLAAPADGQMQVNASVTRTGIKPQLTVYGAGGNLIDTATGGAAGLPASLTVDVSQGDDYYVEMGDAAVTATGKYTLTAAFTGGPGPGGGLTAEVQAVDNSALLTGYVTQDIVIQTDTDWLSTQMVVTLTAGTVYQNAHGGVTSPDPSLFGTYPALQFDTYVSNGVLGESVGTLSAVDLDPGQPLKFDASGLSVLWFTMASDDTGTLHLARVTLSNTATGTWQFRASADAGPQVDLTGTIANGVMTAN